MLGWTLGIIVPLGIIVLVLLLFAVTVSAVTLTNDTILKDGVGNVLEFEKNLSYDNVTVFNQGFRFNNVIINFTDSNGVVNASVFNLTTNTPVRYNWSISDNATSNTTISVSTVPTGYSIFFNDSFIETNTDGIVSLDLKSTKNSFILTNNTGTLIIKATQKFTNNTINTFNITNPTTSSTLNGSITLTLTAGNYTVTGNANDSEYINTVTETVEITAKNTQEINLTGFFTTNVSLNVTNNNGENINTWDATFNTTEYGGVSVTTSNGATIGLLNATWQVRVENAIQAGTNYAKNNQTTTLTTQTTPTINFTLYQTNSFNIEFRDEQTNNLINDRNITVEYISSLEFQNKTTTNGTVFISGLIPTEIQIRYEPTDYKRRNAYFFITNQSFTNITLYSLNNTEGVLGIITATDESGNPEPGRLIKLMRGYQIDNKQEFRTVQMAKTDFGGEGVLFYELNDVEYIIKSFDNTQDQNLLSDSGEFFITSQTLTIRLDTDEDPLSSYNLVRNITILQKPSYSNTTKLWTFKYDSNEANSLLGNGGRVCLRVDALCDLGKVRQGETCSEANTATLNFNYSGSCTSQAIAVLESNTEFSEWTLSESTYQAKRMFDQIGRIGLYMGSLIIYTLATALGFNPVTLILGTIAAVIALIASGFVAGSVGFILTIVVLGGIFMLKMKT